MANQSSASLLDIWETIGKNNLWIREATDPVFSKAMLSACDTVEGLQARISAGGWQLGQGFYYLNLCFINQVDGGDV